MFSELIYSFDISSGAKLLADSAWKLIAVLIPAVAGRYGAPVLRANQRRFKANVQ